MGPTGQLTLSFMLWWVLGAQSMAMVSRSSWFPSNIFDILSLHQSLSLWEILPQGRELLTDLT